VDEAYLKKRLCEEAKKLIPGVVAFRHEDKFTGGIPDCSFTALGRTVWVEVKYRRKTNPANLTALQRLTMSNLIKHGRALVVTYIERDHTLIIAIDRPIAPGYLREDEVATQFIECGKTFNHVGVAGVILQELSY
jgi:hypothetical protein